MPAFKKHPGGRPPKLNEEVIKTIVNYMRSGAYVETAVVCAGVQKQIFYDWMKQAHKDIKEGKETLKVKLLYALERATEEATLRDIANIDKCAMGRDPEFLLDENKRPVLNARGFPILKKNAMDPDWKASAWRLQRRNPKQWGLTEKIELTGKDGGPIEQSNLTEDELKSKLAANLKKIGLLDEPS